MILMIIDDLFIVKKAKRVPVGFCLMPIRTLYFKWIYPLMYSIMSPGWQSRALQIASRVSNRMPLAFPVFSMDRLAWVIPRISANSFDCIFRLASITSMLTIIGIG